MQGGKFFDACSTVAVTDEDFRGRNAVWGYPGYPGVYSERDKLNDAWLMYLMITEDDGLNAVHLEWALAADCQSKLRTSHPHWTIIPN